MIAAMAVFFSFPVIYLIIVRSSAATAVPPPAPTQESEIANIENISIQHPSPANFLNLSLVYYRAKRFGDCIEAAQKAIALKPDFAAAYNNICAANNDIGNFAEGKKAGEEAVRLDPANQLYKNNLKWSIDELNKK